MCMVVVSRYEKQLAAEALRQTDNNFENALDILTDPARNTAMQAKLFLIPCWGTLNLGMSSLTAVNDVVCVFDSSPR
jgi:hypothetical protein